MADSKSLETVGIAEAQPIRPGRGDNDGSAGSSELPLLLPLLASIGLTLSLILEVIHARTFLVPTADSFCAVGEAFDCTVVAASPYSLFLNVPWALWGALGYLAILAALLKRSIWALYLSAVAALTSAVLLGVSLLKIGSLCYLCEAVHITSWVLFGLVFKHRASLAGNLSNRQHAIAIFAFPILAAASLALFLPPYWGDFSYKVDPPFATGVTEEGFPWIGSETPSFTFHEFVDYRCPHCKIASTRTLKQLAKHPDWRMVRRQQPRMRCPEGRASACRTARIAHCAGQQGKFWRADRWLFAALNPRKDVDIRQMAKDLDLQEEALKACFTSGEAFAFAQSEYRAAVKAKLLEVPGYLVNGKRYREKEFEELIQNATK